MTAQDIARLRAEVSSILDSLEQGDITKEEACRLVVVLIVALTL